VQLAYRVMLVLPEQPAHKVMLVLPVPVAYKVMLVLPEQLALLAQQDHKVMLVQLVRQD
jgi:hypothetical protein